MRAFYHRLRSRSFTCRDFLQLGQAQLGAQLLGAAIHPINDASAVHAHRLGTERFQQMAEGGVMLEIHALHFQQLITGGSAGLDRKAWCQAFADGQQHGVGQCGSISAGGGALLAFIPQPQAPFGRPLAAVFASMHRQQGIGPITLGRGAQRCGVRAFKIRGGGDDLFVQVTQRQAQRQTTVLGRATQRLGDGLAITDQAAAFHGIVQPPTEDRWPIAAPQRQARATQRAVGADRVEIHLQAFRRAGVVAILTDDLLRVFADRRQARAIGGLGVAGQADHQGLQGTLGRLVALLGRLTADRLQHLIETIEGFGITR